MPPSLIPKENLKCQSSTQNINLGGGQSKPCQNLRGLVAWLPQEISEDLQMYSTLVKFYYDATEYRLLV